MPLQHEAVDVIGPTFGGNEYLYIHRDLLLIREKVVASVY